MRLRCSPEYRWSLECTVTGTPSWRLAEQIFRIRCGALLLEQFQRTAVHELALETGTEVAEERS